MTHLDVDVVGVEPEVGLSLLPVGQLAHPPGQVRVLDGPVVREVVEVDL